MIAVSIIIVYLLLIALGLFFIGYFFLRLISSIISNHYGAPYVPLEDELVECMLSMAQLHPGDVVYDLGCGDGRILFRAVADHQVIARGYEISYYPYLLCRLRMLGNPRLARQMTVERKDFFTSNISDARAVLLYQHPDVLKKLATKLRTELQPGSCIVSARYPLPGWKPEQEDTSGKYPLYMYRVGSAG
ncbi:MAG TPA: class I SAM-dependent methyltransferase [bacterium]|nr:class I SAM-dependent methyltransferase [bacterium]